MSTQTTIISGTDRVPSHTRTLADFVVEEFRASSNGAVGLIDLAQLQGRFLLPGDYGADQQSEEVRKVQDELIVPATAFYIIVPEYNGSFPGVLKYFLDACSVRHYKESFAGKKAAILGLATGRAGNLRGMDHLTAVLQYLDITVMPNRLPISRVGGLIRDGRLADEQTAATLRSHIVDFVAFCR